MLIQMKEIKTKTYPLDKGFFLDITTGCKEYNAWLYHKDYGIKSHIYGMFKCDIEYNEFLDLLENTINDDIDLYVDNYFDYKEREIFYENYNNKIK